MKNKGGVKSKDYREETSRQDERYFILYLIPLIILLIALLYLRGDFNSEEKHYSLFFLKF